jgi:hypothetical protein
VLSSTEAHLLDDERHGSAFVQEPQLAIGVLAVAGVSIDASVQQRPVEIAHQRTNVPATVDPNIDEATQLRRSLQPPMLKVGTLAHMYEFNEPHLAL